MKILYSCLSKSWGGMEMVALNGVKQLLKKNISVELLCIEESRLHIEANDLGIIIHPIKVLGYFHPIVLLKLAAILKSNKYKIIHSQASKDLWFLVPALKLIGSKSKLLFTKQVGSFVIKKDFLHNWLYSRVDLALAISRVIKKNLIDTTSLKEEKILLHPNGVDISKFNPETVDTQRIRESLGISNNEFLIGMVARLSPGKGHEEFLLAAKSLSSKYDNLKFIVVGEASRGEDEYAKQIKYLAEDYNLKNLSFLGYRSDIPGLMAAMDVFVFPSHAEAFGIALIEAMAMETASVCTRTDGFLDIVIDNESGLFFEKKDAIDLADKIEILIQDKQKRIKIGKAGRQRVIENFDIDDLTDSIIHTYKNILNK